MAATKMASPEKTEKFLGKAREDEAKAGAKFGKEVARLEGMKKGGKVRATGKRSLHKGEMVARKKGRSKTRGSGRY